MPKLSKQQRKSTFRNSKSKKCPHNNKDRNQSWYPSNANILNCCNLYSEWNSQFRGINVAHFHCDPSDSIQMNVMQKKYGKNHSIDWCSICKSSKICIGDVGITNLITMNCGMKMGSDFANECKRLNSVIDINNEHIEYLKTKIDSLENGIYDMQMKIFNILFSKKDLNKEILRASYDKDIKIQILQARYEHIYSNYNEVLKHIINGNKDECKVDINAEISKLYNHTEDVRLKNEKYDNIKHALDYADNDYKINSYPDDINPNWKMNLNLKNNISNHIKIELHDELVGSSKIIKCDTNSTGNQSNFITLAKYGKPKLTPPGSWSHIVQKAELN